jgi:TRAP-type mannitol/chloroaromatic compound transport system permease small subunit
VAARDIARRTFTACRCPLKSLSHILERLALAVLLVGGFGMLMSMFLGVADIVGTQILLIPVPGPRELTESTMVLIVFGALAYAQIRRAHIRVELLYFQMPPRIRYSLQIGEATDGLIRFPLWPARFVLAAGCALVILQLMVHLIQDLIRIKTGEGLKNDPLGVLQKVE